MARDGQSPPGSVELFALSGDPSTLPRGRRHGEGNRHIRARAVPAPAPAVPPLQDGEERPGAGSGPPADRDRAAGPGGHHRAVRNAALPVREPAGCGHGERPPPLLRGLRPLHAEHLHQQGHAVPGADPQREAGDRGGHCCRGDLPAVPHLGGRSGLHGVRGLLQGSGGRHECCSTRQRRARQLGERDTHGGKPRAMGGNVAQTGMHGGRGPSPCRGDSRVAGTLHGQRRLCPRPGPVLRPSLLGEELRRGWRALRVQAPRVAGGSE
mmetsp:Transcript_92216/g.288558  ORF Transcript_92216/g.288558 Transcript_92216/m.288558 type:complete len:267 (+) Transcript_92216:634-1434(+)